MSYLLIKSLHTSCVAASYTLFLLRGIWVLRDSPIMQQRWVKIVPHIIDTALLTSAVALAWMLGQYPFMDSWLTSKVCALLLYIALGYTAFKNIRCKRCFITAWIAAQFAFAYIVLVAINHNPYIF